MLGLDYVPSVFQGRISGAKGMWMVDCRDEKLATQRKDHWIEIIDSQLKFEGRPQDVYCPDPTKLTFEVRAFSRKLTPASLNFQLLPILVDRGVSHKVLMDLLEEDLTTKVSELQAAMENGLALLKWNQETNGVSGQRRQHDVEWLGGLPASLAEKINWFVDVCFGQRPYKNQLIKLISKVLSPSLASN